MAQASPPRPSSTYANGKRISAMPTNEAMPNLRQILPRERLLGFRRLSVEPTLLLNGIERMLNLF